MPDIEKVIEYLNSEIYRAEQSVNDIWLECVEVKLLRDALDLIEKQQAKIAEYQMIYGGDVTITGELIRCRDCKHYRDGYCLLNDIETTKKKY